mmetsp:Transcript_86316/g.158145  ORF Transcript_86316/g.158145 Transcript_86316/m.158145 type:complete len:82 (-) Transcript_86316:517-762(-)
MTFDTLDGFLAGFGRRGLVLEPLLALLLACVSAPPGGPPLSAGAGDEEPDVLLKASTPTPPIIQKRTPLDPLLDNAAETMR